MNMLSLTARLRARATDTPDTPVPVTEVAAATLSLQACTPDTPVTSQKDEARSPASVSAATSPRRYSITPVPVATRASFEDRVELFKARHVELADAEMLAGRLGQRDRVIDERRVCLECVHFSGVVDARRCANWRVVGMRGPAIPAEWSDLPQRCAGFAEQEVPAPTLMEMQTDDQPAGVAPIKEEVDE